MLPEGRVDVPRLCKFFCSSVRRDKVLGELSSETTAKIEEARVDRMKDRCLVCEEIFLTFPSVASLKSWK